MIRPSVVAFVVFLLTGCATPEYLTPDELNKFIADPENGLVQKTELNGYTIEVMHKPTDLWVEQEMAGSIPDDAGLALLRNKYNPYYYFVLNLSKDSKEALRVEGDFGQYSDLVQTLSFRMNNYVCLTTAAQDTIPTADFILNRTYGLSSATSVLFVFNKEKAKEK